MKEEDLKVGEVYEFKAKPMDMEIIKTNGRFDKLTNLDIWTHYRNETFCLLPSDFTGAFAYWVTAQNPNDELIDIIPSLTAFKRHVLTYFVNPNVPELFTVERLSGMINEDVFSLIPEIAALNVLEPDFIDLCALARNVFYMVMRHEITQR